VGHPRHARHVQPSLQDDVGGATPIRSSQCRSPTSRATRWCPSRTSSGPVVWLGIATAAVSRARAFVRVQARAKPGTTPPTALRLAEVASTLQTMRANVHDVANECEALDEPPAEGTDALSSIGFALKMNNLKVSSSQLVVQIVHQALLICGIMGYKNDSKFALGPPPPRRALRRAHGRQRPHLRDERVDAPRPQGRLRLPMIEVFSSAQALYDDLVKHRLIIPVGVPGIFGAAPSSRTCSRASTPSSRSVAKDDGAEVMAVPANARPQGLREERVPRLVPAAGRDGLQLLRDRPQHACRATGRRARWGAHGTTWQKMTDVVLTPAACYPVYPSFTGTIPTHGRLVDMHNWVFRHEPSPEPTRMQAFRVREFVRVGTPDVVVEWRNMWLERGLDSPRIAGSAARRRTSASDPFFGRGGRMLAATSASRSSSSRCSSP
jgi:hypothetical protein